MDKFLVGVKAIVNYENKILLLKRSPTDNSNPSKWDFPGGLIDHNEYPIEAIKREILEETGITIKEIKIHSDTKFLRRDEPTIVIFYTANAETDNVHISNEHSEYNWIEFEKAKEMDLQPWIKEHLQQFNNITF